MTQPTIPPPPPPEFATAGAAASNLAALIESADPTLFVLAAAEPGACPDFTVWWDLDQTYGVHVFVSVIE